MTDESKRLLTEHCSSFSPIILGLIEPKTAFHKVRHSFWNSLNLIPVHQNCRAPRCSNIWVLSHPSVISTVVFSSDQIVVVDCFWNSLHFRIGIVHGSNEQIPRRDLWADILRLITANTIVIGDFNAIKGAHERISTVLPHRGSCSDFCNFINESQLIESPTEGLRFTWSGRRFLPHHVESVLDRALFAQGFASLWDSIVTSILPRLTSDHSPLVLQCKNFTPSERRRFRFLNMWILHPSFMGMIKTSWSAPIDSPCPIIRVMQKLKRLRVELRVWNKEVFGNFDRALADGQQLLKNVQSRISDMGYTEDLFEEEIRIQAEINVALARKSNLLQQKSRASWLVDGDRNTAFFHRLAKFRKRSVSIARLNINGADEYNQNVIEQHIVNHFSSLFSDDGSPAAEQFEIDALIQPCISENQNLLLIATPDEGEIAAAIFDMDANSAPGPDGFSGLFFHRCWQIIKLDITQAVQRFFTHSYLPSGCNASTMILIPKKETVSVVGDLRPIVLSNFFFKIISKILASRLSSVAASHVLPNQFGFIKGRNIHDCIMLGSEGLNCMERTNNGINMACKIDIRKAFDTIRWDFVFQVLRANGYHETFINWVSIIFTSARLSILYNGRLTGYFPCSRGVRQGDPLSPILFGIAEDVLGFLINSCVESGHLKPMSFSRSTLFPTHLFYADDVLLFCRATVRNARKIQEIFYYYGSLSGQSCNQEKSNLFFARRVPTDRRRQIHRALGFSVGNLPMTYLGVPIFVGRPRASYFMPIFDRIVQKFARWKGIQLSIAGRLCLVKSVIQSSMVHSMMIYKWPKSLLHSLDRKCRNFVWTGNTEQRPSCPVSWGRTCSPREEGGLGVRSFTLMNQSYLMKLAWKMIKGVDWAHKIMRSRYLTIYGYAKNSIANSSVWLGVKEEVNHLVDDSYSCVGRGNYTYFWKDDWLGYKLIDKLHIPAFMHDFLNFPVNDYFFDGVWHFSAAFVNRFPDVVADILLLPMNGDDDARFWKHSIKGEVSASLAFSNRCHRFPEVHWGKWIWDSYIPMRRSILCWRVIHGRLPTMDILIRQGLVAPNCCYLCLDSAESISHIFWNCPKVKLIWREFLVWFDKEDFLDCLDIHSFLVMAWSTTFSSQLLTYWKAGVISLIWKIWDSRNSKIFDNMNFDAQRVLIFVKSFFKEIEINFHHTGSTDSSWSDYLTTRRLGIQQRVKPPPRMIEVYWWPPTHNWMKVNTDGSAMGAPGVIAAGGVFRDNWAMVRGCFHIKGGVGFAFEAELLAIITAINLAHDRNWLRLWIESDSMYVVRLLDSRSSDVPWRFMNLWKNTLRILQDFQLIITHIYREGNQPADIMAHNDRTEGWWPFAINEINLAVTRDMSTHSHLAGAWFGGGVGISVFWKRVSGVGLLVGWSWGEFGLGWGADGALSVPGCARRWSIAGRTSLDPRGWLPELSRVEFLWDSVDLVIDTLSLGVLSPFFWFFIGLRWARWRLLANGFSWLWHFYKLLLGSFFEWQQVAWFYLVIVFTDFVRSLNVLGVGFSWIQLMVVQLVCWCWGNRAGWVSATLFQCPGELGAGALLVGPRWISAVGWRSHLASSFSWESAAFVVDVLILGVSSPFSLFFRRLSTLRCRLLSFVLSFLSFIGSCGFCFVACFCVWRPSDLGMMVRPESLKSSLFRFLTVV
ncbi:uncharacterized protein LOC131009580 [Salvia miltiorrhiza]|uniref:uncharacterized protein LOC131009580 n=1 Tax=Salvia miltiorrhiza TaxID=226208 RepID=UPI0025AD6A07|nr:uncharacterized protein LOC131009580 [Salvia miltiorrhiza]